MARETTVILNWAGALTPADKELTDQEITDRFGTLMKSAVSAFRSDPNYVVELAESAAATKKRRGRLREAS